MFYRVVTILLATITLTSCDMVKNVSESTDAIGKNKQAVIAATEGIKENREIIDQSSDAIEENLEAVSASTLVIRENAAAVKASTQVIRENAAVVEAATALMPKIENNEIAILLVIALLFFLFGLPLITAHHLSRISRKLTRIEKELKKS